MPDGLTPPLWPETAFDGTLDLMNPKAMVFALAALASTGFGLAAQAPKPAGAAAKVVVYKSPT